MPQRAKGFLSRTVGPAQSNPDRSQDRNKHLLCPPILQGVTDGQRTSFGELGLRDPEFAVMSRAPWRVFRGVALHL